MFAGWNWRNAIGGSRVAVLAVGAGEKWKNGFVHGRGLHGVTWEGARLVDKQVETGCAWTHASGRSGGFAWTWTYYKGLGKKTKYCFVQVTKTHCQAHSKC